MSITLPQLPPHLLPLWLREFRVWDKFDATHPSTPEAVLPCWVLCCTCNAKARKQRQEDPWGLLPSQPSLSSTRVPGKDLASNNKVLWPLHATVHTWPHINTQIIHVAIYKIKSSTLEPSKTCFTEMGTRW